MSWSFINLYSAVDPQDLLKISLGQRADAPFHVSKILSPHYTQILEHSVVFSRMQVLLLWIYLTPPLPFARYTSVSQIISVPHTFETGPHLRVFLLDVPMEWNAFPRWSGWHCLFIQISDRKLLLRERTIYICPSIVITSYFTFVVRVITTWNHLFTFLMFLFPLLRRVLSF